MLSQYTAFIAINTNKGKSVLGTMQKRKVNTKSLFDDDNAVEELAYVATLLSSFIYIV